jgi:hypothetical protein
MRFRRPRATSLLIAQPLINNSYLPFSGMSSSDRSRVAAYTRRSGIRSTQGKAGAALSAV